MRRRSPFALATGVLFFISATAYAQPAGSSPEAAVEAMFGQQSDRPQWLHVEDAQVQALVPACEQALGQPEHGGHDAISWPHQQQLSSCVTTMQSALGWLDGEAFRGCSDGSVRKDRVDACGTAVATFLLQHEHESDEEAQHAAALALMKDLCATTTLCAPTAAEMTTPNE